MEKKNGSQSVLSQLITKWYIIAIILEFGSKAVIFYWNGIDGSNFHGSSSYFKTFKINGHMMGLIILKCRATPQKPCFGEWAMF